jgi:hypothetical protein
MKVIHAGVSKWLPLIFRFQFKTGSFLRPEVEMLAALSHESQINQILSELDCAVSNYAAIANKLSASRVAAALSGTNDFSTSDAEHHLQIARSMKRLADEVPVPIDWRKIERIREVLGTRRSGPTRPIPFAVVLVGSALFERVVSGRVETTTNYQTCAAFKNPAIAHTAANLLVGLGASGLRVTTITNEIRPIESISEHLSDFGFSE